MNTESEKTNKRLSLALVSCAAMLLVAVLLLTSTGFSVITLLKGPKESGDIQTEEQGAFVYRDVNAILGFYAEDARGENVQGRYGLVPMGGKLVSVRFTNRYLESAKAVCDNTYDFINGVVGDLNKYVTVQGTVDLLTDSETAIMYDWFGLNREQLVEMGVINDTDDYADYLTDTYLLVDTVNGHSQGLVIGLSIAAGVLLLCMVVQLVLMAFGFYRPKAETSPAEEAPLPESDGESSEPAEEPQAESDGESSEDKDEA